MKSVSIIFVLATIVISACHTHTSTQSTAADSTTAKKPEGYNVKQLSGVFYDTLPCADCPGIATKIYLKPDKTFVTESNYLERGISYNIGTWAVSDSLLQLTGTSGNEKYKINNYAELEVFTPESEPIEGTAGKLLLHRNNIPFKPQQPVPVEGIYTAVGDTMVLHVCAMNRDYQATLAPAAMIMTAKYKQATKEGQPLYAKLAGHFELRPSLNDTTTQDYFVVEKFIKFIPGQNCK